MKTTLKSLSNIKNKTIKSISRNRAHTMRDSKFIEDMIDIEEIFEPPIIKQKTFSYLCLHGIFFYDDVIIKHQQLQENPLVIYNNKTYFGVKYLSKMNEFL